MDGIVRLEDVTQTLDFVTDPFRSYYSHEIIAAVKIGHGSYILSLICSYVKSSIVKALRQNESPMPTFTFSFLDSVPRTEASCPELTKDSLEGSCQGTLSLCLHELLRAMSVAS